MTFRFWCREKWFEYLDECQTFQQKPMAKPEHYFQRYKWWLKREYQHQQKNNLL
jgi:hypothetical protein